jgi:Protein of unknown function (DUF2384)
MHLTQKKSTWAPAPGRRVRRLLVDASRRAEAMGLLDLPPAAEAGPQSDIGAFRRLATQAEKAGIATATAAALHNVETPTPEELASLLTTMIAALEASPAPKFEWNGIGRVFDAEQLASLLNISLSSLKRYQAGERATPDAIAARLHFLALLVGDLAGSYNDIGVRRWFQRKRARLDGRTPAELLAGEWDPDDPGARRVRELARELVTLSAT